MAQTVKLKRSAVSGNTPTTSDLALGEIAINTYDGNIFIKKNDGTESIVTFSPGSNAGTIEEDSFSGNGSTTAFTLSTAPSSEEHLLVFIDATFQNRDSFTISGTTITFDTAPDNGSSVRVYHVIPGSVDDGVLTVAKFAADTLVLESEGISSNDNDTTIPTSAAVKDYVDTQVATVDTLPEVLANGNTTGGTDIAVSTGDDITFADSSKAIFGAGSDLQIYHDGSFSYIKELGTGGLYLDTNGDGIYLRGTTGNENMVRALKDGAVTLYHDGSPKLATTSTGIDVTGNVAVSGTVDGRDLATDGTKLDGIETSADVTDATNVTAAGALMDSEVTNLAQVKAFDSSDYATAAQGSTADSALQNIVEDTTPQLGGDLASNGNDILFADSDKAIFGTGSDLQIYHDGSNSYITDTGTGNLLIRASNELALTSAGGDAYFLGINGGASYLYYAGAVKLQTTSSGVDVTGEVLADSLDIDGNGDISGNLILGGYLAGPATFTIDPAAVGDNTGTVVIAGNLQVDGTTTTINSTTLTVDDKNITLASGSTNAAAANGAGLTVDCGSDTDATFTYNGTLDTWEFNKELRLTTGSFASYVNGNRYIKYRSAYDSATVADFELKSDNNSAAVARITSTGTADVLQVFDNTTQVVTIADGGSVGIGTTNPSTGKLVIDADNNAVGLRINGGTTTGQSFGSRIRAGTNSSDYGLLVEDTSANAILKVTGNGNVGIGLQGPNAKFQVEEYGIDTTETSTTATTQVAIHTMSATAFRSARFTVQVTNSTDSTYHLTEILMIHDGTTPSITEYGTIFTGSAEATFDADISSGNVRLLATPASTDTMEFKVVAHSITT